MMAPLICPRTTPAGEHLHVFKKSNEFFSVNFDGSAHDHSHGTGIPNKVADAINRH